MKKQTTSLKQRVKFAARRERAYAEWEQKQENQQQYIQQFGLEYCADCIHRQERLCALAKTVINAAIQEVCADAGWRTRRVSHRERGKSNTSSSGRRRESGTKEK